jgi:hypothetical protein
MERMTWALVDRLTDKIVEDGFSSLSEAERALDTRYSGRYMAIVLTHEPEVEFDEP